MIEIDAEIAAVQRLAQTAIDPDFPPIAGCEADRPSARITQDPGSWFPDWIVRIEPFESFPSLRTPPYALKELNQELKIPGLGNFVAQVNSFPMKQDQVRMVAIFQRI